MRALPSHCKRPQFCGTAFISLCCLLYLCFSPNVEDLSGSAHSRLEKSCQRRCSHVEIIPDGITSRHLEANRERSGGDSSQAASNNLLGHVKQQSVLGPEMEQMQRSNPLLGLEKRKDLYSLNDYSEYELVADDFKELLRQLEEVAQSDKGGEGIAAPIGPSSYPWARNPRRKRESLGLAGMCCKWGCTKAEISAVCRV
uniref:Insulin-like domain-containing protein n=1 Tax=Meleagris gallopavo TaxID=9103 RepID=G3URI2_MELGA